MNCSGQPRPHLIRCLPDLYVRDTELPTLPWLWIRLVPARTDGSCLLGCNVLSGMYTVRTPSSWTTKSFIVRNPRWPFLSRVCSVRKQWTTAAFEVGVSVSTPSLLLTHGCGACLVVHVTWAVSLVYSDAVTGTLRSVTFNVAHISGLVLICLSLSPIYYTHSSFPLLLYIF